MARRRAVAAMVVVAEQLVVAGCLVASRRLPRSRPRASSVRVGPRMAVLTVGTPLRWPEAVDHLNYVREHGIDVRADCFHDERFFCGVWPILCRAVGAKSLHSWAITWCRAEVVQL